MPSWTLDDADEIAAAHPYTFYKPSGAVIDRVAVGENVKLVFRFEHDDPEAPAAERMWVLVDSIDGAGGFTGRLDNEPFWIRDLKVGDPVSFRACNIVATRHDEPDNLPARYAKRCFVTRRVLDDGMKAGFLYREAPERDGDSGWRITADDESGAYMDDPRNVAFVSLGRVLSKDDSIVHLLDEPIGAAFARDPATGRFVAARSPVPEPGGDAAP